MVGKFIKAKRLILSILIFAIIVLQLVGCENVYSKEMLDMINNGETITIELAKPSYDTTIKGEISDSIGWIQLDQIKTYNNGFRQDFDETFNINIVTEGGINGKSGSLYVDEDGDRSGNTTLEDALRNKVFVNKYWLDMAVKDKLAKISSGAYEDIGEDLTLGILGSFNAYYNLLADGKNPNSFNANQSLSREQFYTLVFKSEEGVKDIDIDKAFESAIGGETKYSKYAQEVDEYGFLNVENKSLDVSTLSGTMSRGEAIYLIVNKHFKEEIAKVGRNDKAFSDTKNGGDLALKLGFKAKDKETKAIVNKDRWQSYTLACMFQNPDGGMQEEIYKTMVVAKNLGLVQGDTVRWDEPISKAEAIQLIVNTHLAKNTLYGYLSEVEYGKINVDKFKVNTTQEELGVTEDGMSFGDGWVEAYEGMIPIDGSTTVNGGKTLLEVKADFELYRKVLKEEEGYTDEDIQEMLKEMATSYGTTLEEVYRAKDMGTSNVIVETPPVSNEGGGSSSGGNGSGGESTWTPPVTPPASSGGTQGVPGTFPKTEWDKDGNGISDSFDDVYIDVSDGEAGRDDDFHME